MTEYKFESGDRVILTGIHYIADTRKNQIYHEAPDGIGSTGTVTGAIDMYGPGAAFNVRWDGGEVSRTSVVATSSLTSASEPTEVELKAAIASITGTPLPPNPDAEPVAKMLQGSLAGAALRSKNNMTDRLPIKVRDVEIPTDSEGNYENHFIVVTSSGIRIKVTVEPEAP